ncbi:MAG TPA: hypothetical protein VLR88_02065 [Propionibacteriaceae bacterium]|nr:hypothetical protein [Propionibacteriaceae bacterium]
MPSYRQQIEILGLLPGHRPEEVLDTAAASIGATNYVDERALDVVAGTARITVRYTVPDSGPFEEVAEAREVAERCVRDVAGVAVLGRHWLLGRSGGRWFPVE